LGTQTIAGADVASKIRIVKTPQQMAVILSSPSGGVYKDIFRRCTNVQNKAKKNLERAPRRIDTGRLRSDIHVQMLMKGKTPLGRVGFSVFYGLYVHDGTGLYGPKGHMIKPKNGKFLRWKSKHGWVYAKAVRGMKPNPFLKDAVDAARI
jgi:hypothetical protein